jgi:hypothetical protein
MQLAVCTVLWFCQWGPDYACVLATVAVARLTAHVACWIVVTVTAKPLAVLPTVMLSLVLNM